MKVLVPSPSVAAVPQVATGVSGNISAPFSLSVILRAEMVSLKWSLQASVAHSRHRVFPVPVGLSSTPFTFYIMTSLELELGIYLYHFLIGLLLINGGVKLYWVWFVTFDKKPLLSCI